jgi:hypothetical protein
LTNDHAPIPPPGWHGTAQFSQHLPRSFGVVQGCGVQIERNGQHPTSDVASYCLRIDEVRRGDNHADANVGGQMNVGHYADPLYIRSATEALKRLRNLMSQWRREPHPNRGLTHRNPHFDKPE